MRLDNELCSNTNCADANRSGKNSDESPAHHLPPFESRVMARLAAMERDADRAEYLLRDMLSPKENDKVLLQQLEDFFVFTREELDEEREAHRASIDANNMLAQENDSYRNSLEAMQDQFARVVRERDEALAERNEFEMQLRGKARNDR